MCKNANPGFPHDSSKLSPFSLDQTDWTSHPLFSHCMDILYIYLSFIYAFFKKKERVSSYNEFPLLGQVISAGLCLQHITRLKNALSGTFHSRADAKPRLLSLTQVLKIVAAFQCTCCFSTFTLKTQAIIRMPFYGNV